VGWIGIHCHNIVSGRIKKQDNKTRLEHCKHALIFDMVFRWGFSVHIIFFKLATATTEIPKERKKSMFKS